MTDDTRRPTSAFPSISVHPPYGGDTVRVPTPPALDDAAKVAAVKNSNGDLKIPRRATPWLLAATSAIASGLVLCAAQHPNESVRLACAIGATVVQTFGAGISGGLEKKPKR